jgi:yecA family protein
VSEFDLPSFDEVTQTIGRLQLGMDASELHGALCGFVCGGGTASPREWLRQLALDPPQADSEVALAELFDASCAQLVDPQMGLQLLLPDEGAGLGERADALIAWARGFLGGFGLAGGDKASLSEEASEALQDLASIAGAQLSYDDPDSDEDSLMEISEFIRVAALLLQGERQPPPDPSSIH